jgi:hypothetical protein
VDLAVFPLHRPDKDGEFSLVALAQSHARNSTLLAEDHRLVGATGCLPPVLLRPWPPRTGGGQPVAPGGSSISWSGMTLGQSHSMAWRDSGRASLPASRIPSRLGRSLALPGSCQAIEGPVVMIGWRAAVLPGTSGPPGRRSGWSRLRFGPSRPVLNSGR